MADLEQAAYEKRVTDLCSIILLHALIVDSDPESRDLDPQERLRVANETAAAWAASRGYGEKNEG